MSLTPQEMSVPAGDGLILKGNLTYPAGARGAAFLLPVDDLLDLGVATLVVDTPVRDDLIGFFRETLAR
jgi:hypothetical protein